MHSPDRANAPDPRSSTSRHEFAFDRTSRLRAHIRKVLRNAQAEIVRRSPAPDALSQFIP